MRNYDFYQMNKDATARIKSFAKMTGFNSVIITRYNYIIKTVKASLDLAINGTWLSRSDDENYINTLKAKIEQLESEKVQLQQASFVYDDIDKKYFSGKKSLYQKATNDSELMDCIKFWAIDRGLIHYNENHELVESDAMTLIETLFSAIQGRKFNSAKAITKNIYKGNDVTRIFTSDKKSYNEVMKLLYGTLADSIKGILLTSNDFKDNDGNALFTEEEAIAWGLKKVKKDKKAKK